MFSRPPVRIAARALPIAVALGAFVASASGASAASPGGWPPTNQGLWPLGILQKENLAKPHPKAAFDLTGTWTLKIEPANGGFNFLPLPKLKPAAQALYDAGQKANAEGKAFRDDTGACWPAGMPKWWTRVWPIQFMQYPTGIIAIQGLLNAGRWIYLDGRGHIDPDIGEPTYNGDSIGRWEGDTLVVDTINFQPNRHWVMQGVPVSDQLHIIERIKMAKDGESFTVELTMIDPVNWEGEWKNTKTMVRVKGDDVVESHCLPDLNDRIVATRPEHNTN